MTRARKPLPGQLPLERPILVPAIRYDQMDRLAAAMRRKPNRSSGVVSVDSAESLTLPRLLAAGVVREKALEVLEDIESGGDPDALRDDCARYSECLMHYNKHYGEAADIPARCPKGCMHFETTPSHIRHELATRSGESNWADFPAEEEDEVTVIPKRRLPVVTEADESEDYAA